MEETWEKATRNEETDNGEVILVKQYMKCPRCGLRFTQPVYQARGCRKLWRCICSKCAKEITFVIETDEHIEC